jgi:exodeoxyribonuclease III
MRLVSWNVNGIRAAHRKGELERCIKELKPDILCIQETKAMQGQCEVDLPEYEEYWNSAEKKGYSGTAIFTKKKPISVRLDFPESIQKKYVFVDKYGNLLKEGRLIVLEFPKCFVATVYTPNAKGDLSRLTIRTEAWDAAFLEYMLHLQKEKPVLFSGDLNVAHTPIDLTHAKANEGEAGYTTEERENFSEICKAGFVDTFRLFTKEGGHYTWWSAFSNARERNVGWRIDYWLVSASIQKSVKHAAIHPTIYGSDHCPVSIDIEKVL